MAKNLLDKLKNINTRIELNDELKLPLTLIRKINPAAGVCNDTRLVIIGMHPQIIEYQ